MGDFILIIKISRVHSGIALVPLPNSRHSHFQLLHTPLTSRFVTPYYLGILWKDYSCVSNLAKFTVVTELLPWLAE